LDLVAEVSFDFQNHSADPHFVVIRPVGENLLRERVHAETRLSATDCAYDCRAC
jgi:hypothetical protein